MTRGQFDPKGDYKALPDGDKQSQYQEQILLKYGFTDNIELAAQTIYQQNYIKQGNLRAHDAGLGDSLFLLRYCTCHEKEEGWFPDIDGMLQLKVPTGKYQHLDPNKLGTDLNGATSSPGAWTPGIGIDMTKKLKPFILHFDYIYSFPREVRGDGVNSDYANFINSDFSIEYFLTKGFSLMLEANTFWQKDKYQNGTRQPSTGIRSLTISPGIGWANDKIQTEIAYQRVVLGKNTTANDSIVLTLVCSF
ncbi:MAG: transporter [Candidatus Omnitrophica bacterium]|nr:transporter [Candidatus Omnitrophota bacterium]